MEIVARQAHSRYPGVLARGAAVVFVAMLVLWLTTTTLGLERHVIRGDAMEGSLSRGALVLVDRVPAERLRVGDVITFPAPDGTSRQVTRRIVDLRGTLAVTRGDARGSADPWVLRLDADMPSRVTVVFPWLGLPWLVLGNVGAHVLLAGLGTLLVALVARRRVWTPSPLPRPKPAPSITTVHGPLG